MNKKKIENFDKEQLKILLSKLKDIDYFIGFTEGAFVYYLTKYEADILLDYIDKLEILIESLKLGVTLNKEQERLLDSILFGGNNE